MYFKSIISGLFISFAVVSFSANAALVTGGVMELETTDDSPLKLEASGKFPTSQIGTMTGDYLGLDWVLEYTALLNYELSNNNGVYSTGTYTSFKIVEFLFDTNTNTTGTSTSKGFFTDGDSRLNIIEVTSAGNWSGAFGGSSPIDWEGKGSFRFLDDAKKIDVSAPATIFLSIPALIGLLVLRRRAKNSVA
jgi:hypothetical protein